MLTPVDPCIEQIVREMGLRLKVTRNVDEPSYCLDMALAPPPRATLTVDDALLERDTMPGRAELLWRLIEKTKCQLLDSARAHIDGLDHRHRIVKLSNEDKCTLHDMLDAAIEGLQHTGGTDKASLDRRDAESARFRDLVERLFR